MDYEAEIGEIIKQYRNYWRSNPIKAREIIENAFREYPNDYLIMHYYMWNIGGDLADNDPDVLIAHKDEFLSICAKILEGCTDEYLRLGAWNMRAKILHAEGNTDEALDIYKTKFKKFFWLFLTKLLGRTKNILKTAISLLTFANF